MKRLRPLLAVVITATGLIPGPAAATATTSTTPSLRWGDCPAALNPHPRQQCADLAVPLDYRHPHGRHITVRISRIRATDPTRKLGTLIHAAGGPGFGSLDWPTDMHGKDQPPQLRERYDLVGFDPRGVRYSTPISCGTIPDPLVRYPQPDGSIHHTIAYARDVAAACIRRAGLVLPHITTANTARDLDRIRAALGLQHISYYGLSYGTYLGAVYASMYPQHTDRILLDSAIDPNRVWYDFVRLGSHGIAQRLPDLTTWIAERHDTYGLGRTAEQVHQRYRTITATLDTNPLTVDDTVIDGNWLRYSTHAALKEFDTTRFAEAATIWKNLAAAVLPAEARLPKPTAADNSRRLNVTAAPPSTGNPNAVIQAIQCGDAAWPRNPRHYANAVRADRARYPDDAGRSANITPCAFWPTPTEPPATVTDRGPRNILILQNQRDPNTPLTSGRGARAALGQRAALITADSGGHGVIGNNECATTLALHYLTTDHPHLPSDHACPAAN